MKDTFLLHTPVAVRLYEQHAKNTPIFDYHCHLSARDIEEDLPFTDIADLWLGHDHYKWRAMRYAGVPESFVTGSGDPKGKFRHWARTVERLIGSPLYHWTHMELETCFGIKEPLTEKSADEIYERCNRYLQEQSLSPVKLINAFHVQLICTTDDPIDDLDWHIRLHRKEHPFQVLPTFRPDRALYPNKPGFPEYVGSLAEACGTSILTYDAFLEALTTRLDFFKAQGCLFSDHSLEQLLDVVSDRDVAMETFETALRGVPVSREAALGFQNLTLIHLANAYAERGMIMQLHLGAMRNNNRTMFESVGPDAGFDIMNDLPVASALTTLFDSIQQSGELPKTILYTLNHKDNLVLSTVPHCFSVNGVPGKIQHGAPWWFNDHKDGFLTHFASLANQGMLAEFIGMLTDSRSFLSYVRHDYFRRILCDFIGNLVSNGEYPDNEALLGEIVSGICHRNIEQYCKEEKK